MINVLFETSVLSGGHAARGIGTYARLLLSELEKNQEIKKTQTLLNPPWFAFANV